MGPCERATSSSMASSAGGVPFACSDLNTCTDVVFPGSVSIKDLTVTGSQYIEHEVHLYIGDPLISLNTGVAGANTYDIGWVGERGSLTNVAAIWDESADQFALVSTPDDGSAHGNLTIDKYEDLKVEDLIVTGSVTVGAVARLDHDGGTGIIGSVGSTVARFVSDLSNNHHTSSGLCIEPGGNVGIGTLSPSFKFEIEAPEAANYVPASTEYSYPPSGVMTYLNNQYATNSVALMAFKARKTSSIWYAGNAGSENYGNAAVAYAGPFVVGNRTAAAAYSEKFRITPDGNVGVGTTDPTSSLTVAGTVSGISGLFEQSLHISGNPVSTGGGGGATSSNLDNGFSIDQDLNQADSPTLAALTIDDYIIHNGDADTYLGFPSVDTVNIIAGGHSALKLDNSVGNPVIQLNNTNADIDVQIMADDGSVILHADAATNMVGIGTASPTSALEVSGTISGATVTGDSVFATHIQEQLVDSAAPSNNDVLKWNAAGSKWVADTVSNAGAATSSNLDNGYTIDQNLRTSDDVTFDSGIFNGALAVGLTVPSGTVGSIVATNDIISAYSSDERLKDNITPIPDSLTKISQIAGVEFDWNEKAYGHLEGHDVGVIAQEIETVLPEAVTTRDDGYKAVKYEKIIPLLIEGFKEQGKRINALEKKLEKGEINARSQPVTRRTTRKRSSAI